MASKNKTTIPTCTQDPITQNMIALAVMQRRLAQTTSACEHYRARIDENMIALDVMERRLAQVTSACDHYQARIDEGVKAGAAVEPGRFFLNGASLEVRQ
jgi:hypothetical protein